MKSLIRRLLVFTTVVAFVILCFWAWHEHRTAIAYRELAKTTSSVTAITVYDCNGYDYAAGVLTKDISVTSAQFPVEVFSIDAGCADYDGGWPLWKGASLAVFTMRDGSERRARFSYYGGFFALEGVPGIYVVKERQSSQFYQTFSRIIDEQFAPKRKKEKSPLTSER